MIDKEVHATETHQGVKNGTDTWMCQFGLNC